MAREILLSKKADTGLRLDPRTKLLLIFIISIFVMGGTGGEAMGLIRLVLCTVPAILLLTSKQCAKAVGYIAVFSAFFAFRQHRLCKRAYGRKEYHSIHLHLCRHKRSGRNGCMYICMLSFR